VGILHEQSILTLPSEVPGIVKKALIDAQNREYCDYTNSLTQLENGFLSVEARITNPTLSESDRKYYRVRLLIPPAFPYLPVKIVPLDPHLRWFPHQFGDWEHLGVDKNIVCPPQFFRIDDPDLLLLPYLKNAYDWISAAARPLWQQTLIKPEDPYEFPHLGFQNGGIRILVEGGASIFQWVENAKFGTARLSLAHNPSPSRILLVREMVGAESLVTWSCKLRENIFGDEEEEFHVPWIYVGDPVVEDPHRPPYHWTDLPTDQVRKVLHILNELVNSGQSVRPFVLVGFAIPVRWGDDPSKIVWQAIELQGFDPRIFTTVDPGFRRRSALTGRPSIRGFLSKNRTLKWLACTDVSNEALLSREGSSNELLGDLNIAVLGVGAVGSILTTALSKMGTKGLLLIDNEYLEPGNIIRHESSYDQVYMKKVHALQASLNSLRRDQSVEARAYNIITEWNQVLRDLESIDLVIDATGDRGVHARLSVENELKVKLVAWCWVKPGPDLGFLALRSRGSTLWEEKAEEVLAGALNDDVKDLFEGKIDTEPGMVWPEPGCYSPTFVAPYYRLRLMIDSFIATLLAWIREGANGDVITLFEQRECEGELGINTSIFHQIRQ